MASSHTLQRSLVAIVIVSFLLSSTGRFVDGFLAPPSVSSCRPDQPGRFSHRDTAYKQHITTVSATLESETRDKSSSPNDTTAITSQFVFDLSKDVPSSAANSRKSLFQRFFRRKQENPESQLQQISFSYDSHILGLNASTDGVQEETATESTTGVILIHPIGVGIGKWFYNRLLQSLYQIYQIKDNSQVKPQPRNLVVVVPDLLGSGTAANPMLLDKDIGPTPLEKLPLLQVNDWSLQIGSLMADLEQEFPAISEWCVVANGGCSPIALQVAQQSVEYPQQVKWNSSTFQRPVTHVVLSSVPRLPFFLPEEDTAEGRQSKLDKVQKSYKTLCGILGRLFWWYALLNQGAFIQKFSERNLVANATSLGEDWTPNCVATARMHQGKSRYSTFSFLAGSLQVEGCRQSLDALQNSGVWVDIVQGRDRRRNRAKSWFWQKRTNNDSTSPNNNENNDSDDDEKATQKESLQQVLQRNGNRGDVIQVGGRISLAHEDAPGYARALLDFLIRP